MPRPDPRAFVANWRSSELSLAGKLRAALRNNAIKARNRSQCCGNHGEPGC